jgi:hypothetical protein
MVTVYHRLSDFNIRNTLSHSCGGWEAQVKVSVRLVPSKSHKGRFCAGLWLKMVLFSMCLHMVFPGYVQ